MLKFGDHDSEPVPTLRQVALGWLVFALAIGAAYLFRFSVTHLVWSLWISGFIVGYSLILTSIWGGLYRGLADNVPKSAPPWQLGLVGLFAIIGGLFSTAFFTVHFGGFHVGHGFFLHHLFPLEFVPETFSEEEILPLVGKMLGLFWPIVILNFFANRKYFRAGKADVFLPYKRVVKMHLLIFVFVGFQLAKVEIRTSFLVYALTFAVFFLPLPETIRAIRGARG